MKSLTTILFCLLAGSASTRASDLKITYYSDPPFATLYQGSERLGVMTGGSEVDKQITPEIILEKALPKKWVDCFHFEPLTAVWSSGAKASSGVLTVCPNDKNLQFTFKRPTGVPGADIDWGLASDLYKIVADFLGAQINAWDAFQAQQRQAQQNRLLQQQIEALQRPLHCNSYVVGNTISTNCN